jgi:PAS domain S-box-containing protein
MEAFTTRLHPEDRDRVAGLLQAAIDTSGDYSAEYRVRPPGGDVRWLAARGRALCDKRGTTVRVLGAAWDITERRAGQERVAQLVEGMAVGFLTLDRNWMITHVNAEAERIIGVPRAELLGRDVWDRFPEAVGSEFEVNYWRAAETGQQVIFDSYYPAPLDIWVEGRATPAPDGLALLPGHLRALRGAGAGRAGRGTGAAAQPDHRGAGRHPRRREGHRPAGADGPARRRRPLNRDPRRRRPGRRLPSRAAHHGVLARRSGAATRGRGLRPGAADSAR